MNRTVHTFGGSCSRFIDGLPPCDLSHFHLVPVIGLRGTFKLRDAVSDDSLRNLYIAGHAIKK